MTASLGVSGMSGSTSQSENAMTSLTTSDDRNIMSADTSHSKWNKYATGRSSVGTMRYSASNGGFSGSGFGNSSTTDGLPRYSVSDMSMDMLKKGNTGSYYSGDLSQPSSPLNFGHHEIEQDQRHYNATTGQVRTPPRYVIPAIDEQQQFDMGSFSSIAGNSSVISSTHLMSSYNHSPSSHHNI